MSWVAALAAVLYAGALYRRLTVSRARLRSWERRWSRSREVCAVCLKTEIDGAHIDPVVGREAWEQSGLPRSHWYEPARVVAFYGDLLTKGTKHETTDRD